MSKNVKTETTFIADTLPTEFESVLGAMILCGWSYQLFHKGQTIVVTGRASDAAREAKPRTQDLVITLVHEGDGKWFYDGAETGLARSKESKTGLMVDLMNLEKMVDYVGRRADPETLVEIEVETEPEPAKGKGKGKAAKSAKEAEVVDEEVIDETVNA